MKLAERVLSLFQSNNNEAAFDQKWKDSVKRAEEMIQLAKDTMKKNNVKFKATSGDLRPKLNRFTFKITNGPKIEMNVQKNFVIVNVDGKEQRLNSDKEVENFFSKL